MTSGRRQRGQVLALRSSADINGAGNGESVAGNHGEAGSGPVRPGPRGGRQSGWEPGGCRRCADPAGGHGERGRARTAVLSNTNVVHWEQENRDWDLEGLVDEHFLSFRTGRLKPDADAYEEVCERMGVAPAAVLFLDDNLPNVEGARAVGMAAEHVVGFGAARRVLRERGLLRAGPV